jgi:hypothetical protein
MSSSSDTGAPARPARRQQVLEVLAQALERRRVEQVGREGEVEQPVAGRSSTVSARSVFALAASISSAARSASPAAARAASARRRLKSTW